MPIIRSTQECNFVHLLDDARKKEQKSGDERLIAMRSILDKAVTSGHVLPLFYSSSLGIARHEIDLSAIPISDESMTFSKIRFRK